MLKKCFGCLAEFEKTTDEPVLHPYIGAIAECWELYGQILAKEYSDPAYFKVHRITIDAYAAQHIGNQDDRRSRQSGMIHLIALSLIYSQKFSPEKVLAFLHKATETKRDWPALIQRQNPYWLTIHEIAKADDAESHIASVTQWGKSVWEAYQDCHDDINKLFLKSTHL